MQNSTIYLCINLPQAETRRQAITAQAQKLGLDIQFVEAVAGRDLPADVPEYDRAERRKRYHYDLTPNEIACALSHRKALQTFLDSAADYAVIMEDDALLAENFNEGIREVIEQLHGWEVAKLYTDDGSRLYPLEAESGGCVRAVFPSKILWVAVGYLYTRSGAEKLQAEPSAISLAADARIGHLLLERDIPTIGISPSLITTSDPNNEQSTIDTAESSRKEEGHRTPLQYLRYRLSVMAISRAKKRMITLMKQHLHRAYCLHG